MLQSMTGFGRAELTAGNKTYLVEIKALNGKQLDIQLKLPPILKSYEFDIRKILQQRLVRGSIDCYISVKQNGTSRSAVINADLLKAYFLQITEVASELKINADAAFASLLRLPEIMMPANDILEEKDFEDFKNVLEDALLQLTAHRKIEGEVLENDLRLRIKNIQAAESEIMELEPTRMLRIKEEINQLLLTHVGKENFDNNRMEQELIYYMEKIDIHEEQIRLQQHCEYFYEVLGTTEEGKGKKLSFVLQEIGREINTTGSKAYDAIIQQKVVGMKDELEKAKEQVLNVL